MGLIMRFMAFAVVVLGVTPLIGGTAKAQTIFDVEHARANYRAGIASSSDMELLRRWGRPSGHYPQYGPPRPQEINLRRWWRTGR
jgi:hypothetical protein